MGKEQAATDPSVSVSTKAVINEIGVKAHADKISFSALSFTAHENELMSSLIKGESAVRMTIDLPKPDKDFPPIAVVGKLKSQKISKTCDSPQMIEINFSSGQIEQITNYVRAEQEIALTFLQIQGELPFEKDQEK